jgi:hypothetical protein
MNTHDRKKTNKRLVAKNEWIIFIPNFYVHLMIKAAIPNDIIVLTIYDFILI